MKDDVAQEREGGDESDEIESQQAETTIESRNGVSRGRLISEGGVINSIIITRSAFQTNISHHMWCSLDRKESVIAFEGDVHKTP